MAAIGFINPIPQFFDNDGNPLAGGTIDVYIAGTVTRQDTFNNSDLAPGHENTNPIELDSSGRCTLYLTPTPALKMVFKDANGVEVTTPQNISPAQVAT